MHLIDQQLNMMLRGRFDDGWLISEKLEKIDPSNLRHMFNRGWLLINRGHFQEGYQCLEAGRFLNVYGNGRITTDKPIWDHEDINDKTVLLNLEGGLGDQIIYVRFAKDIKKLGAKCVVCCDASLIPLFSSIEEIDEIVHADDIPSINFDFWIPSFSCSWLFGYSHHDLPNDPYIKPVDNSTAVWSQAVISDKIKVGIRWSGNTKFEHQQFRIFPPEKLINLYHNTQLQLYSFQRDNDVIELPDKIFDLQYLLISWIDTAAAIANMDLVITSCTSVAHLASAMGKPTWVIVPILPYHIWAHDGEHTPWYKKTTRIFRQTVFGEWDDVFEKIQHELSRVIKGEVSLI
jgi:hypothetical protein